MACTNTCHIEVITRGRVPSSILRDHGSSNVGTFLILSVPSLSLTPLATTALHVFSQESYEPGRPLRKGSIHSQGRGSLSYHKCSARGSQHQQLVQGGGSPHRGHSQTGLPLGGNQLAVDTNLVSPLTRSGGPRSRNLCTSSLGGRTQEQGKNEHFHGKKY